MKLLSVQSDPKTSKSIKFGYLTGVQYFAPYTLSGTNVCPMAETASCHVACLNTAGRGKFSNVQTARVNRVNFYLKDRKDYLEQLTKEIKALERKADRMDLKPAVRLNGTSDLDWQKTGIMSKFPKVQFYDYHKVPKYRVIEPNYHLTWSYSEANPKYHRYASRIPHNIAVVFNGKLPETFLNREVIDGDKHDLRFLDPDCVVVGLKAKGKAKKDTTGFVVNENKGE